jgi:site-specific recombinase XerD
MKKKEAEMMFKEYLKSCGYKENTASGKFRAVKKFLQWFKKDDLRDTVQKDIKEYIEYLNNYESDKSINGKLKQKSKILYLTKHLAGKLLCTNMVL